MYAVQTFVIIYLDSSFGMIVAYQVLDLNEFLIFYLIHIFEFFCCFHHSQRITRTLQIDE